MHLHSFMSVKFFSCEVIKKWHLVCFHKPWIVLFHNWNHYHQHLQFRTSTRKTNFAHLMPVALITLKTMPYTLIQEDNEGNRILSPFCKKNSLKLSTGISFFFVWLFWFFVRVFFLFFFYTSNSHGSVSICTQIFLLAALFLFMFRDVSLILLLSAQYILHSLFPRYFSQKASYKSSRKGDFLVVVKKTEINSSIFDRHEAVMW